MTRAAFDGLAVTEEGEHSLRRARVESARFDTLGAVIDAVRRDGAKTRPEIASCTGLGRGVVSQRVAELVGVGLIAEEDPDAALGRGPGRPGRTLRFARSSGHILLIEIGATRLGVAIADLGGQLVTHGIEAADVRVGPELTFQRAAELYGQLGSAHGGVGRLWAIGVSVPGAVDFESGLMAAPAMPIWEVYPIKARLSELFGVPVWVENDANVLAIGEVREGRAANARDVIFVKVGTHIGAGIIAGGTLQRGARGCAGDIGHTRVANESPIACTCGKLGCLSAVSGSAALSKQATAAASEGASPYLAEILRTKPTLTSDDLADALSAGDPAVTDLITRAGHLIGDVLAAAVNLLNPSMIVIGGGLAAAGDPLLAAIRQSTYGGALPLAGRELLVLGTSLGERGGLIGLSALVTDELFAPINLATWLRFESTASTGGATSSSVN